MKQGGPEGDAQLWLFFSTRSPAPPWGPHRKMRKHYCRPEWPSSGLQKCPAPPPRSSVETLVSTCDQSPVAIKKGLLTWFFPASSTSTGNSNKHELRAGLLRDVPGSVGGSMFAR